jgi:3',5'-nucleoside bisphosphate phosphatase
MPQYVDLHCHSTASDGSLAPAAVMRLAKEAGVSAMSLTDHDTVAGVPEAAAEAQRLGIDFISGIEISCEFCHPGTMHLLGYGVDPNSSVLAGLSRELIEARNNRNPRIIQRLNELGVKVTMSEWEDAAGGEVVGRPHLAQIMVRRNYVSSVKLAFDKYLGQGGAAYFDKERLPPRRALDRVFASGGVPVLAHPYQLRCTNDSELETVVKNLVDMGLAGLEVMHSDHDEKLVAKYSKLADRFGLVTTGGSDFHGSSKATINFGWSHDMRVPREFFDRLRERVKQH